MHRRNLQRLHLRLSQCFTLRLGPLAEFEVIGNRSDLLWRQQRNLQRQIILLLDEVAKKQGLSKSMKSSSERPKFVARAVERKPEEKLGEPVQKT